MSRRRTKIYIRESKDELLKGYSPAEMVKQCRAKAALLDSEVAEVVVEAGKRDELDCPGLLRLIDEAEAGDYDYLVSYDMYRLSGEPGKHFWVKEKFSRTAVTLHYVAAEYAPTPEGDLMELIQAGVGGYERAKTRARTQNGINGKLARRQPICNGAAPYGLIKLRDDRGKPVGYGQHEHTFPILARIFKDVSTLPYTAIAAALNAEGVATPSGRGIWHPSTLHGIVNNATYAGLYEWGRVKRTPTRATDGRRTYLRELRPEADVRTFEIDALIDVGAVHAARAGARERTRRRRRSGDDESDAFGLRGRVWCGGPCGGLLSCGTNHGLRRYTCLRTYPPKGIAKTCTTPQIPSDDLEALVWAKVEQSLRDHDELEAALAAARDPGEAGARHGELLATLDGKIAEVDARLENAAATMLRHGPGTTVGALASRAAHADEAIKRELVRAREHAERQAPVVLSEAEAAGLRELWATLALGLATVDGSPERQRLLYAALNLRVAVRVRSDGAGEMVGGRHRCDVLVSWNGKAPDVSGSVLFPSGSRMLWDSQPEPGAPRLRIVAA